jgi:uncharacterized membrane protein YccC
VFVAIVVVLLSPKGDLAYGGAIAFTLGSAGSILFAAIIKFAVLPGLETFPAFCAAIGLFLIPAGFSIARSRTPAAIAAFTAMGVNFQPLLAVTNPIIYDTELFYNSALAIFAGCAVAALSFRLLPPVSPMANSAPARPRLARPAPRRDRSYPTEIGGLGERHVRPVRGAAGPS